MSAATSVPFSSAEPAVAPAADPPRLTRDQARAEGRRRKAAQAAQLAPPLESLEGELARKGRGSRDLVDGTGEYKLVPIDDLREDPDNPRRTYRGISELCASLKANGMLQPITARITEEGKLFVEYGHRRLRAARMAGWQHVPVIIRYGAEKKGVLARQLTENSARDDLDPIEEARALRRYMDENGIRTQQAAADKLGHSLNWVGNRLALLDLDGGTQGQVSAGKMPILEAVKMSRQQTGNTRTRKPKPVTAYFDREHYLAGRASRRCKSGHGAKLPGAVACGECWEAIIRIDALSER